VANTVIRRDLQTPTVTWEICHWNSQYSARFSVQPNNLVASLLEQLDNKRRLRSHLRSDLSTTFLLKF
jgi:hypothetical protein